MLNINGDKIELNTAALKPDTRVKVNGKEKRFGDLTPQKQKQLQAAVKNIPVGAGQSMTNNMKRGPQLQVGEYLDRKRSHARLG